MIGIGAVLAFIGVAAGAFGTHGLRDHLAPDRLAIYQTAAQYQLVHAIALVALGSMSKVRVTWPGWLFLAGVLVFSGSLYALALTGIRWFGAITPLGGLCFLLGWAILAVASFRTPAESALDDKEQQRLG
jgi:uncharacterized membrane protein YgdD (TMEM256/DUF423 family)